MLNKTIRTRILIKLRFQCLVCCDHYVQFLLQNVRFEVKTLSRTVAADFDNDVRLTDVSFVLKSFPIAINDKRLFHNNGRRI